MIRRDLERTLRAAARKFRVVTITGPRQSGKTTLCRASFPKLPYASLEAPDVREFATTDPRGFLAQFERGAVLDEIQRAPALLSYVQERVDRSSRRGQFILTGSQHLGLVEGVSQSLAGRTAILQLLPLGLGEARRFPRPSASLLDVMWRGSYPEIHDRRAPPAQWYASYVQTYLERDVRQVVRVGDLSAFQTFVRLVAGRAGQLLNLSALGADAGVSQPTARAWLSVLEAGYLVFRLPPLHRNLGKRLTKSPKLYFYDTGLLVWLLGIRRAADLAQHPLRGAVFESWVVSEIFKSLVHAGHTADLSFYRDQAGREVDVVIGVGSRLDLVEIKSGATAASDFFRGLDVVEGILAAAGNDEAARTKSRRVVVYGGDVSQNRTGTKLLSWSDLPEHRWG